MARIVALIPTAHRISTTVIVVSEARSKRPASSAAASTHVTTTSATTTASSARSGCGSAIQTRTMAAPAAISQPIARARARRPAKCASMGANLPERAARGYARARADTRSIQAARFGWSSPSVIRSCSTRWNVSSSSGSIATA